jgi:hypothetical protein
MQLNDIIEENTLKSIGKKTRLSVENLEKLFAQDFGAFRKVQALGFISILEREYHADLSDLREACYAYYSSDHAIDTQEERRSYQVHLNSPHHTSSVVVDIGMEKKRPIPVRQLVIALLVVGLLYAAWQTYSASMQTEENNGSQSEDHAAFFSSIMGKASAWIAGKKGSDMAAEEHDGATEPQEIDGNENSFVIADSSADTSSASGMKKQADQTEEDIIRQVRVEQAKKLEAEHQKAVETEIQTINEALATAPEENNSNETLLATEVPSLAEGAQPTEKSGGVQSTAASAEAETHKVQQEAEAEAARLKAAQEQALHEREARQKAAQEQAMLEQVAREEVIRQKAAQEKAAREKAAQERAAQAKIVVLKPRKKTWLGIVDLTNMKRRTAAARTPQTFDTAKGRWIVATGHGFIDYDEGMTHKKMNDGKQHFLLIEKGKIREISHKKFQRLNKSKVW